VVAEEQKYRLRWATNADYADLADVMFDAVRNGRSAYSDEQRRAWVPERRSGGDWSARLDKQIVTIGEDDGGVVGFMSLGEDGYIDFAYIRPRAQEQGLFRKLFAEIERRSHARDDARLWVHASLMAEPVFAAMGFSIIERQIVAIGPEQFERFEMELNR
jgi:putative acetyltransferase